MTDPFIPLLRETNLSFFTHHLSQAGSWMGHTVQWLRYLPKEMHTHSSVAMTAFAITSLIFLALIHPLVSLLEERVQKLDAKEKKFNLLFIDVFIVGGSCLLYNTILSKWFHYPLKPLTLLAITVGTIAFHSAFHFPLAKDEEPLVENIKPGIHLSPKSLMKKPFLKKEGSKIALQEASKKLHKTDVGKECHPFINDFCHEILSILKDAFHYVNFTPEQRSAQYAFLENMRKHGVAIIEEQSDLCQIVNVSIQAAFEKLLCTMMTRKEIAQVKVLYLSPLPYIPLTTPLQEVDIHREAEQKQWILDIHTQTVRHLQDMNIPLFVSYSAIHDQAFSDPSSMQFKIYEEEKQKGNIIDLPLMHDIPKEFIGALYLLTDSEKNGYVLATQGVLQQSCEVSKEPWKMWFGEESHPEVGARTRKVIEFVKQYYPEMDLLVLN